MELVKKVLKSLLIGSLVGLGIALFTHYFFQDLIDRFENLTYYMRYSWQYDELSEVGGEAQAQEKVDYGIHIVDIDDRSMQKMGKYWNWDRSYHAKLIRNLSKRYPAAIVFDVLFFDPEEQNHAKRLDSLLTRAHQKLPSLPLNDRVEQAMLSSIDYDRRFVHATREAGNVFHGVQMSEERDHPPFARSSIEPKMTMEWHRELHPSSALRMDPQVRKEAFHGGNTKTIVEGIFPPLARAARDIGYVNMPPNSDGFIRQIPLLYGFGSHPPVYLPLSVRTVVTLFGTPDDEVRFEPGNYLDIGKPFKIFKDSTGGLRYSYPNMTTPQVKAIIDHGEEILSLPPGRQLDISTFLKVGLQDDGRPYMNMYAGYIDPQIVSAMFEADMQSVLELPVGEEHSLAPEITIRRDSDVDWILSAPYGYQEWYLSLLDCRSLAMVGREDFEGLQPGEDKLLFHSFNVRNVEGVLRSSIPVLRGHTLRELCKTSWSTIEELTPGMRIDFGRTVRIPLQPDNTHIITFFGPKGGPFPYYSYYDLYKDRVQASMEGKIFIVGTSSPTMNDIVHVPHDDSYPGVEVHASLVNSLLTNTFVSRLSLWHDFLILLLVGIVIGFIAYMLKPLPGAILTVLSVFIYFLIAMTIFGTEQLWIPIVRPILAIILTYTAVMAYRYITEEKDRKFLQSTFKAYLSPELIDMMYKEKQSPKLGGDEGVRTAYFTDIQSFSTFSEKLGSPTRLVELLNEYLTGMTEILLGHYGTLDKYEGDAIIAFFGAPMPMDDHAYQACLTGLDMQTKLGELRRKWMSEGERWPAIVHEMRMRIGINTGAITTGNMGSAVRMNYTMMGDAVNLAARLESAAKQYGVYTMLSEYTYDLVKGDFEVRQCDKIRVVGRREPVVVYELLARQGDLAPEMRQLVEKYNQGLGLFYDQQWDEACAVFEQTEKLEPNREMAPKNMSPSKRIMTYCEMYKENPPPSDWDGVITLDAK